MLGCLLSVSAQVAVGGVVLDGADRAPLPGASVVVKGPDNKIKKFATSNAEGRFSLTVPGVVGCRLEVSLMSYRRQSFPLDSVSLPLTVLMEPGAIELREVAVKADRIREQGDTVTYNVGSFAQQADRSIGDVLKRMPGIDVSKSGKISYQGEDINKFYIEGSDLLGGKYGVATNGISHEDVGAVEVLENHQPLQVLAGLSYSDKAAVNLKLKSRARATWSFHGDAAGGWAWQPEGAAYEGQLFAMAVMPGFQNITTLRANNTGDNLSESNADFFAEGRNTSLDRYVNVGLPSVPSLNERRTLFNRSFMLSSNSLWKAGSGEFKANIDYTFDRLASAASNVTTYFLDGGDRVITENRDGREHSHSLGARFIYELNRKTAFVNNTLRTDIDWNDITLTTAGTLPNLQHASLPDYYVGNDFKLIQRFRQRHLVTFRSVNEWESLPQALTVDNYQLPGVATTLNSQLKDHAFYTHEGASYAFNVKGVTVSLEGGVKGYFRSMRSQLPQLPEEIPGLTENVVQTNYLTLYATPKLEYWLRRVTLTLTLPVSYAHYAFDKSFADRDEVYFSPTLKLNWKPNNRFSGSISGGTGRAPMNLGQIHPGLVMTDYRTLKAGTDNFYTSTSQRVSAHLSYKHTRRGLFASAMAMQSWSSLPYTLSQVLYGDYAVYSYADASSRSRRTFANGTVGKTLDFMRGSLSVNGTYTRSVSHLFSQEQAVSSVTDYYGVGARLSGAPAGWLSFDYVLSYADSRLSMNGLHEAWLSTLKNELTLTFVPATKWQLTVSGEHYRNELADGDYKSVLMLDSKIVYRLSKLVELGASLTNILNLDTYNYISYSQISSFESRRQLRGRQLLLSITLRT